MRGSRGKQECRGGFGMAVDYSSKIYSGGPSELSDSFLTAIGIPRWAIPYLCPHWATIACVECEHPPILPCLWECWDCEVKRECPCWRCDRLCDFCPDRDKC